MIPTLNKIRNAICFSFVSWLNNASTLNIVNPRYPSISCDSKKIHITGNIAIENIIINNIPVKR